MNSVSNNVDNICLLSLQTSSMKEYFFIKIPRVTIALNLPVLQNPSGIYGIEGPSEICTQSAEMRLAVDGAQPLFTLGLLMFVLFLVDFPSLLLSPSTYFKIFYFCQKYHLKDTFKIFKKFHVALKFELGL